MGRGRVPKVEPQDAWRMAMAVAADPQSGVVISLPGRLDVAVLEAAVAALLEAEPVLACRYVGESTPRFERVGVPLEPPVEESAQPMAAALTWSGRPVDPSADRLFAVAVLRGAGTDVLALRVHHVASDPYGARELAHRLAEAYSAIDADRQPSPTPARSRGTFQVLRRVWPHRSLLAAYAENPGTPEWGLAAAGEVGARTYATELVAAAPLEAYAVAHGTDVEALVVTALFRALAEVLDAPEDRSLLLNVGIDLRRHTRSGVASCAACNLSGHESLRLTRDPSASFGEVLASVDAGLASLRGARAGLRVAVLVELAGRMGPAVLTRATAEPVSRDRERGRATPLVADLGEFEAGRLRFGALEPDAACVLPPVGLPPFVEIGFSRFGDTLTLAAGYPLLPAATERVSAVLARSATELARLGSQEEASVIDVADSALRQ